MSARIPISGVAIPARRQRAFYVFAPCVHSSATIPYFGGPKERNDAYRAKGAAVRHFLSRNSTYRTPPKWCGRRSAAYFVILVPAMALACSLYGADMARPSVPYPSLSIQILTFLCFGACFMQCASYVRCRRAFSPAFLCSFDTCPFVPSLDASNTSRLSFHPAPAGLPQCLVDRRLSFSGFPRSRFGSQLLARRYLSFMIMRSQFMNATIVTNTVRHNPQ